MSSPIDVSPDLQLDSLKTHRAEGFSSLFRNKTFLALWLGQVFSQLADRIVFVVFVTLIVTHFGHAGSLRSILYVAFTIPAILLTAAAGVFVDRWHRGRTLVISNLFRAGLIALVPLAVQIKSLWLLYACAFGISSATQFFVPAESATIPMVVRSTQLLAANSLFTTTMMASIVFGFALGDPMIHLFGLKEVHWGIVGLFVLSAVALCFVRVGYPSEQARLSGATKETLGEAYRKFLAEMQEGLNYLRQEPLVLNRMLKLAILFSAIVAMCFLFISFAETTLYADPSIAARKFSWLITFSGLGMVLGALLVGKYLRHVPRGVLVYSGFAAVGIGTLLLMATGLLSKDTVFPTILPYLDWRVLFAHSLSVVLGIGAALVAVPLQAVLHELIPEDKRGKVMGVQFTLLSTCSTLPALIVGFGADLLGVTPMLAILGLPLLILGGKGLYDRRHFGNGFSATTW